MCLFADTQNKFNQNENLTVCKIPDSPFNKLVNIELYMQTPGTKCNLIFQKHKKQINKITQN
jgi:hypothetical protein